MKKLFLSIIAAIIVMSSFAQEITVPEPEFINSYCILTSDSTFDMLPKENGTIGKHENKSKSILGKIGKIANVAGAAGSLGAVVGIHSGSLSGAAAGLKAMRTASSVGSLASSASALAGSVGMDIIFSGKASAYSYPTDGQDIRLLVKGENNEQDPMGIYRIVRFNTTKKERRIQWMEIESSVLGTEEAKNAGYVNFTGHKYGGQSYILTIPVSDVEPGEYGIFYMSIVTATAIPVGTFSVK